MIRCIIVFILLWLQIIACAPISIKEPSIIGYYKYYLIEDKPASQVGLRSCLKNREDERYDNRVSVYRWNENFTTCISTLRYELYVSVNANGPATPPDIVLENRECRKVIDFDWDTTITDVTGQPTVHSKYGAALCNPDKVLVGVETRR